MKTLLDFNKSTSCGVDTMDRRMKGEVVPGVFMK
jgi:hypothetical protein